MRAVYRSQASFVVAMEHPEPREAAVAAALSIFDFCAQHPADARLLASFGREELVGAVPTGPLAAGLGGTQPSAVERAVVQMAKRLYGKRTRQAIDRTMFALLDLPYGATRRHLVGGTKLPAVSVTIWRPRSGLSSTPGSKSSQSGSCIGDNSTTRVYALSVP